MRKLIHIVLLAVLSLMIGIGIGNATGASDNGRAKSDRVTRITWGAMNSVTNSTVYSNPSGKSDIVECTVVATGTNTMSIWLQTSANGNAFANAITSAMDIVSTDTDSLQWYGNVKGGDQWRLHTEDSDVDVTNTVTFFCDFWR